MSALPVSIIDHGSEREVWLNGPAFYHGAWHAEGAHFRSPYAVDTLQAIHRSKGAFLYDEILRVEDPSYLAEQFLELVTRYTDLKDRTVLDFGCGCGSSSILLARAGARVRGVELMAPLREIARLRVRDEGLGDRIEIVEAPAMTALPFAPASFDHVAMNAVVEHVRPEERGPIVRHLWDLLKPGGLLVVTETPNRLWPYDGHTTRLPLIPWLPLHWACVLARRLRASELGRKSDAELVYDGIVGATFWDLIRLVPPEVRIMGSGPWAERAFYFGRLRRRKRGAARILVEALAISFVPLAGGLSLSRSRIPLNAFFPYLNIAFQKQPAGS